MTDARNSKFIFDFPLSDVRSGGYVSDEWVFLALSVSETAIAPYVDGKPSPGRSRHSVWPLAATGCHSLGIHVRFSRPCCGH